MIDELESELRRIVAEEIGSYMNRAVTENRPIPDELDQRQMGHAILRRELDNRCRASLRHGEVSLTPDEEDMILDRVLTTAFSATADITRLLQRRDMTDLYVNGCDDVRAVLSDGTVERLPPFARSDQEMIEKIQMMASPLRTHGTRIHAGAPDARPATPRRVTPGRCGMGNETAVHDDPPTPPR